MSRLSEFWNRQFGTAARIGLIVGAVVIVTAAAFFGHSVLRTDYQVLFSDLTAQDTAAMVAELERLKIPYVLSDQPGAEGATVGTIMVDHNDVYKTRIKLMGRDIPLHGAVGLELFNNNDLGMTEFAQKINYQRALQGELTRTILSLSEVRDARILLALPDQGLFKQTTVKPKASVTLLLKPGQGLRPEQVSGIQRLVSAAVTGIQAQDVTIVDQSGVALTRAVADGTADNDLGAGSARLNLKKDTENYLSRKATQLLENALGAGQASASVDVALNMDRVQSSTDELMGAPSKPGEVPTGLVTRQRDSTRDVGTPLGTTGTAGTPAASFGGSNQREVEYALGHRVEQVISQPGSVRRIEVAVLVRKSLSTAQQEQVRLMVAAAVGASFERGDAVVVQTVEGLTSRPEPGAALNPLDVAAGTAASQGTSNLTASPGKSAGDMASGSHGTPGSFAGAAVPPYAWAVVVGVVIALVGLAWKFAQSRRELSDGRPSPLTDAQRQEALGKLKAWIREGDRLDSATADALAAQTPGAQR